MLLKLNTAFDKDHIMVTGLYQLTSIRVLRRGVPVNPLARLFRVIAGSVYTLVCLSDAFPNEDDNSIIHTFKGVSARQKTSHSSN